MKDIELCGLGNALVDLQVMVTDEELKEAGLEKGAMVLIDTDEKNKLLEKFSYKDIHKVSGGSAANTVISFAQLGGKGAYKTVLGKDNNGEFYAHEFSDLGITLKAEQITDKPTGVCVVLITPDSERTMYTNLSASTDFGVENVDEELIARSEWLFIEGYKFSVPSSNDAIFRAVEDAKKYNTKISVTSSDVFITEGFRKDLIEVVKQSDMVFLNETEARSLTGKNTDEEAFNSLCEMTKNVAVTLGPKGSLVSWNGNRIVIPSYSVNAIDSTGAGDSYAGAFFYGILKTGDAQKAGNLASYVSSKIVSQMGARASFDMHSVREQILSNKEK